MLLIITIIMMIMGVGRENPRIVIKIMPVMMMIMTMAITMIMMMVIYIMIIIMVIAMMIMMVIRGVEEKTLVWNLPTVLEAPGVSFDKIVINARNDQVYDHIIILTRGGC